MSTILIRPPALTHTDTVGSTGTGTSSTIPYLSLAFGGTTIRVNQRLRRIRVGRFTRTAQWRDGRQTVETVEVFGSAPADVGRMRRRAEDVRIQTLEDTPAIGVPTGARRVQPEDSRPVPLHLCGAEQLESKTKKWAKLKALGRGIRKTLKFGSNAVIATIAVPLGATTLALALALKFYHLATHIIPKDECGIIELILGLAILPVEIVLVITSVLTLGCVWVVLSEEDFDELWMQVGGGRRV